jgi:hypothetical protein
MKDRPAAIVAAAAVLVLVLVAWKSEAAPAAQEPASRRVSVTAKPTCGGA